MATQKQIVKRALVRLGEIAVDDIPTAEQETQCDAVLESIHADWVNRGFIRWDLDEVPIELENALVSVLAYSMADDFGVPAERYSRLQVAASLGSKSILIYGENEYVPQNAVYY